VIVAQRFGLVSVKILISNPLIHLELFRDHKGNLFLSSPTTYPKGIVYYATTSALLFSFTENLITLQKLFNESPSRFVEINSQTKTALYCVTEIRIQIVSGKKRMHQLQYSND
jgi:hypothetical protein